MIQKWAKLVLQDGVDRAESWPLPKARPIVIGRGDESDVMLANRRVSRRHAQIIWNGWQYQIQDLGSKNGTYVNGERVTTTIGLESCDRVQIALWFTFTFVALDVPRISPQHICKRKGERVVSIR